MTTNSQLKKPSKFLKISIITATLVIFLATLTFFIFNNQEKTARANGDVIVGDGTAGSCDENSLKQGITDILDNQILAFDCGANMHTITLTSGQIDITKSFTIDGSNLITLAGSGSRIFNVLDNTTFNLKNLTFTGGNITGEDAITGAGGAVRSAYRVNLNIDNCIFNLNKSSFGGGAIYTGFQSNTTVLNSKFTDNEGHSGLSQRGGGAISGDSEGSLTVKNSEFIGNKGVNGGAIYNVGSNLILENNKFAGNDSTLGASIATSTESGGHGGAIFNDGTNENNISVKSNLFDNNTGSGQGGAMYLYFYDGVDKATLDGNIFKNNQVITNTEMNDSIGGAVRPGGNGEIFMNNNVFEANKAVQEGGAVWAGEQMKLNFTQNTFVANQTTGSNTNSFGGAVSINGQSNPTVFDKNTFVNNISKGYAGSIYTNNNSVNTISVKNSIFVNNTAENQYYVKQETFRNLVDEGNNYQFPDKLTSNDPNDNNVTSSIQILDSQLTNYANNDDLIPDHPCSQNVEIIGSGSGDSCSSQSSSSSLDSSMSSSDNSLSSEISSSFSDMSSSEFSSQASDSSDSSTDSSMSSSQFSSADSSLSFDNNSSFSDMSSSEFSSFESSSSFSDNSSSQTSISSFSTQSSTSSEESSSQFIIFESSSSFNSSSNSSSQFSSSSQNSSNNQNPYLLPIFGKNGEQYIYFSPEKSAINQFGTQDLKINVKNFPHTSEGAKCEFFIRQYGSTNWTNITTANNIYQANSCSDAVFPANKQNTAKYEIKIIVTNPNSGNLANKVFQSDIDYMFNFGALSIVTISAS
jgi:hypothetical protein